MILHDWPGQNKKQWSLWAIISATRRSPDDTKKQIKYICVFNLSRWKWRSSTLLLIMTCCLFGLMLLSETMLAYYSWDAWEHIWRNWYDSTIPIQLQESENIGCTMAVIFSRSWCFNGSWCITSLPPCIDKATPSNCDKFDEWMLYSSITGLLFSTWTTSIPHWISTVYPKKYAHGFVVLCFVVVMQSFIINSHDVFIHIHQGCFAGTGAIVRLPQCQWSKPGGYGEISQCITTTKHSKAKTVCTFLGIYCISSHTMIYPWWDCSLPL